MKEYAKKPENKSRALNQQGHADQQAPASVVLQRYAPQPNNTGLPDHLKTGIESLSGYSMDDVKVHYNSAQPAQLNALAYAQGTDIHIAPGQEHHLPHEAWHVVQQKQGRVSPTMQLQGVNVNDNEGLEREADRIQAQFDSSSKPVIQCQFGDLGGNAQYTSRNQQGEDGSIYFRLGRLRLIHDGGPEISIHPQRRRYLINGDFNLFRQQYRQANIQNLTELNDFMETRHPRWTAQWVNPNQPQSQGPSRLFEVFLDQNQTNITGTHPSRGGTADLNNPISVDDQRKLYYIVKYSQQFAKMVESNINQNEVINQGPIRSQIAIIINQQQNNYLQNQTPDTLASMKALHAIASHVNTIIDQGYINTAIQTAGRANSKRIIGFIGNSFLRNSFDLQGVGLTVRNNN